MKLSTTIAASLAGATTAEKPTFAPLEVTRADWYNCWDLAQANLNIGVDAITLKLPAFYYDLRKPEQGPDALGNKPFSACNFGLSLDLKRDIPGNWKFRITDYTLSGTVKTSGGANIDMFKSQPYMDYWTAEQTAFQLIRKAGRTQNLAQFLLRDVVEGDGKFIVKGTAAPDAQNAWSPCFGQGSRKAHDTFDLWIYSDVSPSPYDSKIHPADYSITVGARDGKSDVELRWGVEWAECDPVKEPNSAWGRYMTG